MKVMDVKVLTTDGREARLRVGCGIAYALAAWILEVEPSGACSAEVEEVEADGPLADDDPRAGDPRLREALVRGFAGAMGWQRADGDG